MDKTAQENTNPPMIYDFLVSINNTVVADKVAGDRKGKSISDTISTFCQMSYILAASIFKTDFTFKAIIKDMFSSAISRKRFSNLRLIVPKVTT